MKTRLVFSFPLCYNDPQNQFGGVEVFMDTYWSTYVQESRELYESRALRFHGGNRDEWLRALRVQDGMDVLEVGCGGGIFCHRIKTYLPNVRITGLDFDTGHIEFAKAKTRELGLECEFISGDACALPFADNTFDLCYSHTVCDFCEPHAFVGEQYRVLRPGGKMVILFGINGKNPEGWEPADDDEEKELFDRVWAGADKNGLSEIRRFDGDERHYFGYLSEHGFKDISADALAAVAYAPDCANVSAETAEAQINENRLSELCSAAKAYRMAPDALTAEEYDALAAMINRRWDRRLGQYRRGERLWEYRVSTVLAVSGTK